MMIRALVVASVVVTATAIQMMPLNSNGFAAVDDTDYVESLDDDAEASPASLTEVSDQTSDSAAPKSGPQFDESGLLMEGHDPKFNDQYGYVGEWKGSTKAIDSMNMLSGAASAQPVETAFLSMGESVFREAEMVDSLNSIDKTEAYVSTMEASQKAPFHAVYAAAMQKYEKRFKEHFPEPLDTPFRFREHFEPASQEMQFETKDDEDYVWVPVPRNQLVSFMETHGVVEKKTDPAAASMRFSQVRAKQDPTGIEDGTLPFDAVTPANMVNNAPNPSGAWNQLLGSNQMATGAYPGSMGGLYAGGLQAPPPPPRPDNLPPPPYILPFPQPAGESAR